VSGAYVTDVNSVALLSSRGCEVCEGVRRHGGLSVIASITAITAPSKAAVAAAATKTTATEAATAKAISAAAAVTETGTSVTVLTHLEGSPLPVVAVELLDGIARVFGRFKCNNTGSLRPAAGIGMDICTDHGAVLGCMMELSILVRSHDMASAIGQLQLFSTYQLGGTDPSGLASQH